MALTYRQTKGSALTIQELDANFQFFTGSHSITGSLTISGSLIVTGSTSFSGSVILPMVSQSLNFANDTLASASGVPLGGLYRNGSFIQIRLV
jgi:hypothetical protein